MRLAALLALILASALAVASVRLARLGAPTATIESMPAGAPG